MDATPTSCAIGRVGAHFVYVYGGTVWPFSQGMFFVFFYRDHMGLYCPPRCMLQHHRSNSHPPLNHPLNHPLSLSTAQADLVVKDYVPPDAALELQHAAAQVVHPNNETAALCVRLRPFFVRGMAPTALYDVLRSTQEEGPEASWERATV